MVREMRSQTVTSPIPLRHTHGRFPRRSSPLKIETKLGIISPKNGRFPTT